VQAAVTLAQLLRQCSPNIGPRTMAAIVEVESGGRPYVIHDNTLDRTFTAVDTREAVAWSYQLLRARHSIDLGIAQINNANLTRLGMSVPEAFDPCVNLHGGATILAYDYQSAVAEFGPGQFALRRAIGAYNTGSIFSGYGYIEKILAAAGLAAEQDFVVPNLAPLSPFAQPLSLRFAQSASVRTTPPKPRRSAAPAAATVQGSAKQSPILVPVATVMQPAMTPPPAAAAAAAARNDPSRPFVLTVATPPVPLSTIAPAPVATATPAANSGT
jgi:type IV secretion system protein VirB1